MNEWLLRRLEGSPDSRFYEWELRMHCRDFEEILEDGLLVRDLEAEKSEFCFNRWGQHLHLERLDDVIIGVDTQNPESIVEVDPKELVQYRFNLARWQEMIRSANALQGKASRLHKRLLFLGEKVEDGLNLAFVLAFVTPATALDLLLGLPDNVPSRYQAIVVTTPVSCPLQQQDIARLEHLGVYVVPPLNGETLAIEVPRLQRKREVLTGVRLPAEPKEGYRCRLPILITGERTKWHRNKLLVNGFPVLLGDALFIIFLRLVTSLLGSKNGSVTKAGLRVPVA